MTGTSSTTEPTATRALYSWGLLGAAWTILLINFAFPLYGAGVMNGYMATDLGVDRKTIGLGFSIFLLATGLPGLAVAWTISRIGTRWTLVIGSLLVACGATIMATLVTTGLQAAWVFGLIVGSGVITAGTLAPQTLIARWFPVRRARAMAILLTAIGVGGFVAPPLLNSVITWVGNWRAGWWLLAALSTLAAVIAASCVREYPSGAGFAHGNPTPQGAVKGELLPAADRSYGRAIRSADFWVVCYCAATFSALLAFFVSHLIVHLRSLGVAPMAAALAISMLSLASLGGKVVVGVIGNRLAISLIWCAGFLAMGAGLLLIGSGLHIGAVPFFSLLCGLGLGVSLVALSTMLVELFGAALFPGLMGLVLTMQTVVSAAIPYLAGVVFDATGSYSLVLNGLAFMCLVAIAALIGLRRLSPIAVN